MAKVKPVYTEMFETFKYYADRSYERIAEAEEDRDKLNSDLSDLEKELKDKDEERSAADTLSLLKRIEDNKSDLAFYVERLEQIKTAPSVSENEYNRFIQEIRRKEDELRADLLTETHKHLKKLAETYEEIITEIERVRQLEYSFRYALKKDDEARDKVRKLPAYAQTVMKLLLTLYDNLDISINEGKAQTECCNSETLRETYKELMTINTKLNRPNLLGPDIPQRQELLERGY